MSRHPNWNQTWLNLSWLFVFLVALVLIVQVFQKGEFCNQMGVDFRGFYASAQIARQHGFAAVYDQELQKDFQSALIYRCTVPADQPPLYVAMPYLPVYVLLFIPFTLFDFTSSYIVWISLQLGMFFFYLRHFPRALGERASTFRILQWGICIPLIVNLYLGQINALLAMLLGEFVIALSRRKKRTSGIWLSTLLIKPHVLILLVPGLLVSQNWTVLAGFAIGSVVILSASLVLAGVQGLASEIQLTYQFAGTLIQMPSGMMNWRSLALNLQAMIPAWIGWLIAGVGASVILVLVTRRWLNWQYKSPTQLVLHLVVTFFGTLIISWHSHFYMLMLAVPLLLYLDTRKVLLPYQLSAWLLGPPVTYAAAHLVSSSYERNLFGMGMLALNLLMLFSTLKRSWDYRT
jgi:hypothetical protein